MLIGIMADSHDNLPKIRQAVELFNQRRVKLVLHAGDYIAPFTIRELKRLSSPFIGIFGNNDGEKEGLKKAVREIGEIHFQPFHFEEKRRKILLLHQPELMNSLELNQYDLIIYGHTHKTDIRKEKGTLFINPGECGGWLSNCSTVALVDLDKMEGGIISL